MYCGSSIQMCKSKHSWMGRESTLFLNDFLQRMVVMGNIFRTYLFLARRWMWLFALGAIVCGGATYAISTFLQPIYQASTYLIIDIGASAHPSISDSLQAVPTFAQLLTIPAVLDPVIEQHPGMSTAELLSMISVKPQTNTQIIELDVRADNPRLAADLANQVGQSFARYINADMPGTVQVIPATVPTAPAQPQPLEDAGIGAVVGLILMLLLVTLFEWISNRATSVEQIQELLGMEIMTLVPRFSRKARRLDEAQQVALAKYQMISAGLNVAQAEQPFKLVMFTSALAGEGKSTIAGNVAINLAQAGKRVLLIDLNIHRPALARQFALQSQPGLTNLLARNSKRLQVEHYSQPTEFPGLRVLTAGTQSMNSTEFLRALTAFQFFPRLKQAPFDYVLLDAPPLFAVAEVQILASAVEALVLVVNGSRTPRRTLARTRQVLWRMRMTRALGVVVNQSSWRDYADTHPYTLPQSVQEKNVAEQLDVEEMTMELPAVTVKLLPPTLPVSEPGEGMARLPDTGETEQIGVLPAEHVIRPSLSLSGLNMPTKNGLTKRLFSGADIPSPPSS